MRITRIEQIKVAVPYIEDIREVGGMVAFRRLEWSP